jgi:hypothetical protein
MLAYHRSDCGKELWTARKHPDCQTRFHSKSPALTRPVRGLSM